MKTAGSILVIFLYVGQVSGEASVLLHGIVDTLKPEDEKYENALHAAADAFEEAEAIFADTSYESKTDWNKEADTPFGTIYGKNTPNGKMVTFSGTLDGNVDFVMNETWTGVNGLPSWNKNIKFAKIYKTLTDHADIMTYGNNDILVVTGRDFVSARIYRPVGKNYIMASRSVEIPELPEVEGKIRADLHLAGARFRIHPSDNNKTLIDVLMLVDLKGSIPRLMLEQVVPTIMAMDSENNIKYFKSLVTKHH